MIFKVDNPKLIIQSLFSMRKEGEGKEDESGNLENGDILQRTREVSASRRIFNPKM